MSATLLLSACATPPVADLSPVGNPNDLLIVDCLLPGQVRRLGSKVVYLSARRPIRTPARQCEIRGGEYTAYDRADAGTALKVWLPQAEEGDAEAQTYVGEIFEKGLGVEPDYSVAALWYGKAATQDYSRAQINLGYLYETGLGVMQDLPQAMNLYRQASGIEDGTLEYVSTVEFAKREQATRDASRLKAQVNVLELQLAATEERYRQIQHRARTDQQTLQILRQKTESQREAVRVLYDGKPQTAPESAQALIEIDTLREKLLKEAEQNLIVTKELAAYRQELRTLRTNVAEDNAQVLALRQELQQKLALIGTLTAELSSSRDDAEKATKQRTMDNTQRAASSIRQAMNTLRQEGSAIPESVIKALGEAEDQEFMLAAELIERSAIEAQLKRQSAELEARYTRSISALQSELDLTVSEQTRVAGRLADAELTVATVSQENQKLRARLREQNATVAAREQEQRRLSTKLSNLALSARASDAERRVAEASTRVANAELALARFEQSRLVTRLVEVELAAQQNTLNAADQLAILEKQLATQTGIVDSRQQQLDSLEQTVTQGRAQAQTIPAESVAQVVVAGPAIEIINPPVLITRGPAEVRSRRDGSVKLIGRVTPVDNLLAFSINGEDQGYNASGVFDFQSSEPIDQLELVAIDEAGERTSVNVSVAHQRSVTESVQHTTTVKDDQRLLDDIAFGRYHAIIIGNNRYTNMNGLRTAESDARVIDTVLRERYGFTTDLLINASKIETLRALNSARETLTDNDNLIIYYAGHGQLDPDGASGYWLPVDADLNNTQSWISNTAVTGYLDSMPAKQILVVADSCFSGTLTQASIPRTQDTMTPEVRAQWLRLMAKRKVRTVLSSGGVKPVYDGTSQHSLFARAFIDQLSDNTGVLEGYQLFSAVRQAVQQSAQALGVDQVPQYSAVKHAGHEVGEFLLVSR